MYDHNDFLTFVASIESVYDSDKYNEFIDDQKIAFLNNLVVEHEKIIKNYLRDHDIIENHKTKIDMLKEKRTNLFEKVRFLKSKHHYLLEKNNALSGDEK